MRADAEIMLAKADELERNAKVQACGFRAAYLRREAERLRECAAEHDRKNARLALESAMGHELTAEEYDAIRWQAGI